jgi:hypothetical protein
MAKYETEQQVAIYCEQLKKNVETNVIVGRSDQWVGRKVIGIEICLERNCPIQKCRYNTSSEIKESEREIDPFIGINMSI